MSYSEPHKPDPTAQLWTRSKHLDGERHRALYRLDTRHDGCLRICPSCYTTQLRIAA